VPSADGHAQHGELPTLGLADCGGLLKLVSIRVVAMSAFQPETVVFG
jgi:hypothetical protein